MKIEILTRQMEKKADLLTLASKENGFYAKGGYISSDDLMMEIGPDYILLGTGSGLLAERVVKELFNIKPVPFAPAFYELTTDLKILITASARTPLSIMPGLSKLEHLDLDRMELAGYYDLSWRSRDVAVLARPEVMVQGGLAVCRVKFNGHFRESEYHCRACLDKVSMVQILEVFTDEGVVTPAPPAESVLAAEARTVIAGEVFSDFLNLCPAKIFYNDEEEFSVVLGGEGDRISFRPEKNSKGVEVFLHIEEPSAVDLVTLAPALGMFDFKSIRISQKLTSLSLLPENLIRDLGFVKSKDFFVFTYTSHQVQGKYSIKNRDLTVWVDLPGDAGTSKLLPEIFSLVSNLILRVKAYAF